MTTGFLFFANLVLLLRLPLLLADQPVRWRGWLAKGLIEIAALGLFAPQQFLIAAGLTSVVLNLAGGWWDARPGDRNARRLLFGALQLLLLSLWFAPAGGVRFRPELGEFGDSLRRWSALGGELDRLTHPRELKILLGLLLAANEANLLVRWLLGWLGVRPGTTSLTGTTLDAGEFNRGRTIGVLERVLIYSFVLAGQYGAIGFTLAAKGFTRFKELENRGFAEYVLIGTLLSSAIALVVGAWVKAAT